MDSEESLETASKWIVIQPWILSKSFKIKNIVKFWFKYHQPRVPINIRNLKLLYTYIPLKDGFIIILGNGKQFKPCILSNSFKK